MNRARRAASVVATLALAAITLIGVNIVKKPAGELGPAVPQHNASAVAMNAQANDSSDPARKAEFADANQQTDPTAALTSVDSPDGPVPSPDNSASAAAADDPGLEGLPEQAELIFRPMADAVQPIKAVDSASIPDSARTRTIEYDGHRYLVYTKPDADSYERFIGMMGDGVVYPLGTIGGDVYEKQIEIGSVDVFGQSYVQLTGYCGANCMVTQLVRLSDGVPKQRLFINYPVIASDWNGDGTAELVYMEGMPIDTVLLQLRNDQLVYASANEAVKSPVGIIYNIRQRQLEAGERQKYRFEQGDHLVSVEAPNQ